VRALIRATMVRICLKYMLSDGLIGRDIVESLSMCEYFELESEEIGEIFFIGWTHNQLDI
jgi:hypothetical protein